MTRRLLQMALALWPEPWRSRDGPELLELAEQASRRRPVATLVTILDLVYVGLRLRLSGGLGQRPAMAAVTLIVVAALAGAWVVPSVAVGGYKLSPATHGVADFAPSGIKGSVPSGLRITLNPQTGQVVSITGRPVTVVMDPRTGAILSIKAARSQPVHSRR